MKSAILTAGIIIIGAAVCSASLLFHRNKNETYTRDNPSDRKAAAYSGEILDADGDGIPDFTVTLTVLSDTALAVSINGISTNHAAMIGCRVDAEPVEADWRTYAASITHTASMPLGAHTLYVKIKGSNGKASGTVRKTFTVEDIVYVATTGNDTNSGARVAPVKTIQTGIGIAAVRGVNKVYVKKGVYTRGDGLLSEINGGIIITNNGIQLIGGWNDDFTSQIDFSELDGGNTFRIFYIDATNTTVNGFIVKNGKVTYNTTGGPTTMGGGIIVRGASNTITNCNVNNNSAVFGGGIAVLGTGHRIGVSGFNNAAHENGGGIYCEASSTTITGRYFGNTANTNGGGMYLLGSYQNCDVTVFGNSALIGGGIYKAGAYSIMRGTVYGNIAMSNGGGMCLSGQIISNYTFIYNNSAVGSGGGIYASFPNNAYAALYSTVSNNNANVNGGGIALYGGHNYSNKLILSNTLIGNSAGQNGGGIYIDDVSSSTMDINAYGNKGGWNGGGIYMTKCSNVTLSSFVLTNSLVSVSGAGIMISRSRSCMISGSIYSNMPEGSFFAEAGGLYIENVTNTAFSLDIRGHVLPTMTKYGAAITMSNGVSNYITNCVIRDNNALDSQCLSVIALLGVCSNTMISNCLIAGVSGTYAIAEHSDSIDVMGHVIVNNIFVSNTFSGLYREHTPVTDIGVGVDWTNINAPSFMDAAVATNNTVTNW